MKPTAHQAKVEATFRFYEELNDFLSPTRRRREFRSTCARAATTKHMIEALGVPHTEVELILVNGKSVGFDHLIEDNDRVAVYPKFETFDVTPLLRIRAKPLRVTRFVADVHLGGLARLLRAAGFDTLYEHDYADERIARLAADEQRIVLTRDRELLKRSCITHGCYVRSLKPSQQLLELFQRLDLRGSMKPFTLCLRCNKPLTELDAESARGRVPPRVATQYDRFRTCPQCRAVFWEGSHWRSMKRLLDGLYSARIG